MRAVSVDKDMSELMGIDVNRVIALTFFIGSALAAAAGTMAGAYYGSIWYFMGFLIGLKGFVGAIIGGLASYPVAAGGAVMVGLIEAYASFSASAYKEVLVFTLIVPVLAWRSFTSHDLLDEEEG